ncbi:MAG: succinate--CoA ligase subunit beta, partial [Nitrospirae bacterium]|nr:succinate--CoA ligase subunit beta [Nitrospirota bacterium]
MNVHEFQAKQLFGKFGVPVPRGRDVWTTAEAEDAAAHIGFPLILRPS